MHGSNPVGHYASNSQVLPAGSTDAMSCVANVAGTELVLMANRMAWWPDEKLLLLADAHFGKAATFRKAGLPVPVGTTGRMLAVLSAAIAALQPARLVILGDFIHSAAKSRADYEDDLTAWRLEHAWLPITLVLGNHDRRRYELFRELRLDLCGEEMCGPFYFCHDPLGQCIASDRGFRLGGHIHPGIRLAKESRPMPCFWQGESFLVFPAFGVFTGLAKIAPSRQDFLYPIDGSQIARLSTSQLGWPT